MAIQDIQPYSVVVSWQSRDHLGLNGFEIVYHATGDGMVPDRERNSLRDRERGHEPDKQRNREREREGERFPVATDEVSATLQRNIF